MYGWFTFMGNVLAGLGVALFVVCAYAAHKNLGPGRTMGMTGFGVMALSTAAAIVVAYLPYLGVRSDAYMLSYTLIRAASVAGLALVVAGLFQAGKGRAAARAPWATPQAGWAAPPATPAQYSTPSWPPSPGGGQPPSPGAFAQPGLATPQPGPAGPPPGPPPHLAPMSPGAAPMAPPVPVTQPVPASPDPGETGPSQWTHP